MKSHRDEIDKIDENIKKLVKRRLKLGEEIATVKKAGGSPILDLERMKTKSVKFTDDKNPYAKNELSAIMSAIMSSTIHSELHAIQKNMLFGLIGKNISSSLSPQLHKLFGLYKYNLFDIKDYKDADFINADNFCGANITMPFKDDAFAAANIKSHYAELSNSVNTLVKQKGTLYGFNTDVIGIDKTLDMHAPKPIPSALILGNGATSRSACIALLNKGVDKTYIANRNNRQYFKTTAVKYINFKEISELNHVDTIINATPEDEAISPYIENLASVKFLLDMNYTSAHSHLMQIARKKGAKIINGLTPLIYQGIASFDIFCSTFLADSINKDETSFAGIVKKALGNLYPSFEEIYSKLLLKAYNILIIGMPGCGKSHTAKTLGELANLPVIDIDDKIETHTKISNEEFILKNGIQDFRKTEEDITIEVLPKSGHIIAAGGGLVENAALMQTLSKRCIIIHIETLSNELSTLETSERPLSDSPSSISKLYAKRNPLYELYSDYTVSKNGNAARQIAKLLNLAAN